MYIQCFIYSINNLIYWVYTSKNNYFDQ